jgi:hypothetical protein
MGTFPKMPPLQLKIDLAIEEKGVASQHLTFIRNMGNVPNYASPIMKMNWTIKRMENVKC